MFMLLADALDILYPINTVTRILNSNSDACLSIRCTLQLFSTQRKVNEKSRNSSFSEFPGSWPVMLR